MLEIRPPSKNGVKDTQDGKWRGEWESTGQRHIVRASLVMQLGVRDPSSQTGTITARSMGDQVDYRSGSLVEANWGSLAWKVVRETASIAAMRTVEEPFNVTVHFLDIGPHSILVSCPYSGAPGIAPGAKRQAALGRLPFLLDRERVVPLLYRRPSTACKLLTRRW